MTIQLRATINVGDKVTFDNDEIKIFKAETSGDDNKVRHHQQLILAGLPREVWVKN